MINLHVEFRQFKPAEEEQLDEQKPPKEPEFAVQLIRKYIKNRFVIKYLTTNKPACFILTFTLT